MFPFSTLSTFVVVTNDDSRPAKTSTHTPHTHTHIGVNIMCVWVLAYLSAFVDNANCRLQNAQTVLGSRMPQW